MVCTTFDESLWIVCGILNTSTTNIHVIARFTIQLMGHNSEETITCTTNIFYSQAMLS